MTSKIKELLIKYKEVLFYLIFGVLTTIINYVIYIVFRNILPNSNFRIAIANIIAWVVAVAFAYITNRKFVFESTTKSFDAIREIATFVGARIFSLFVDTAIMYAIVYVIKWNDGIAKIISNVFVVIINYLISKLIIFKKK